MLIKITNNRNEKIVVEPPTVVRASRNVDANAVTWANEVFKDVTTVQFERDEPDLIPVRVNLRSFPSAIWAFTVYAPWAPIGSPIDERSFSKHMMQWLTTVIYKTCSWRLSAETTITVKAANSTNASYINCDYIAKPQREAVSMKMTELGRAMLEAATPYSAELRIYDDIMSDGVTQYVALQSICSKIPLVRRDNKYHIKVREIIVPCGDEFTTSCDIGLPLMGFHRLSNGISFFGFQSGETYHNRLVFSILYHDGTSLRLYTPTKGNLVNADLMRPLDGNTVIRADDKRYSKLFGKYVNLGTAYTDDDENLIKLDECYLSCYELTPETAFFNWDAIKEDINTTLYLKN